MPISLRQKAKEFATRLNLPVNTSKRTDCPVCGGSNTFSVTNEGGKVKAFCFKASCAIGIIEAGYLSAEDIKDFLGTVDNSRRIRFDTFYMPEFVELSRAEHAKLWLSKYNCTEAVAKYPGRFKYDIKRDRVVFLNLDGPYVDFATGRSLAGNQPKWYKYFGVGGQFKITLHSTDNLFIVEDCASACSVARLGTAIALCGTSYDIGVLDEHIRSYSGVKVIHICLDEDAHQKAFALTRDIAAISRVSKVRITMLSDDAKNLSIEQLKKETGL